MIYLKDPSTKNKAREALFNKASLVLVYLYTQVVAALEVVQLGFGVVVIAPVAQGVYEGNVTCVRNGRSGGVGNAEELAVGIIAVVRQGLFLRIGNSYNIALQIRNEVVK